MTNAIAGEQPMDDGERGQRGVYEDDPESVRVWTQALADPAFAAAMDEATDPTVHHHFYRFSEVKAERHGGPPPKCTSCGQVAER